MDTTTPTGKMIFTVLGAVAELERSLIVERVRAGLRNARAKGKTLGQAACCRGRRENCRSPRTRAFVGEDRGGAGSRGGNGVPARARIRHKPHRKRARKSLRASSRLSGLTAAGNNCLLRRAGVTKPEAAVKRCGVSGRSLGAAYEFAQFDAQSSSQSVRDFNPYADFPQFD